MNTPHSSAPTVESTEGASGQESQSPTSNTGKATLIGSIITGIAASTCCLGPFILLTLGVSGSWIGNLSAMEPYRPIFIGITLLFLGLTYRKLFLIPQACDVDKPCAQPANLRKQRIIFWIVSVFVLVVMTFPWYGPYLLD